MNILILDDEEFVRVALTQALHAEGCTVTSRCSGDEGLDALSAAAYDCVITDLRMPGLDGRKVLAWIMERQPDVDVIVLTGFGEVPVAVEAIKAGAWDFLVKDIPFDPTQVTAAIAKLKTVRALRQENLALRWGAKPADRFVPGRSQAWHGMMALIEKLAPASSPVLIQGETGSGKEMVARRLHQLGPRRDAPFLAINCGAVSAQLLESELFGHEKGAFTGAASAKIGLIAAAQGGTLLLDEIGEMPGPMQVSLLRVLDRGEYRQVGGTRTVHADVRFVAATNRDLQQLVHDGRFRDDLLYRINTVTVRVPPLRERRDDLPALADHFLDLYRLPGTPVRRLASDALARLSAYPWPGNVRELRNVIERVLLLSAPNRTEPITAEDLAAALPVQQDARTAPAAPVAAMPPGSPGRSTLDEAERLHIARVFEAHGGNKTQTAKALDIDYKTLVAKLRKYKLIAEES